MVASPEPVMDWQTFMREPALYIERDRFAACFEGAFSRSLCRKLQDSYRLRSRLSSIVQQHYQLGPWIDPEEVDEIDREIALALVHDLTALAQRAGAIYWSSTIASTVLAKAVTALHQQLGDELCSYAISQRDLAGPAQSLEPLETVGDRIEADGWRCLSAWCASVAPGIGLRVQLRLPKDSIIDRPAPLEFVALGPEIIRRAAA
jgi:YOP proteins translocation protein K (YscK)